MLGAFFTATSRKSVSTALLLFALTGCSRQPAPIIPANAVEKTALSLASKHVPSDWTIPIKISPGLNGAFIITYWTPDREMELLGPRQAIVTPSTESVEIVLRC